MKITIEIPDKYIEVARGLALAECKSNVEELHIEEVANIIKDAAEPIAVGQDTIERICKEETGHMNMLFALFAFDKVTNDKNY
jgi:hypothetical protein